MLDFQRRRRAMEEIFAVLARCPLFSGLDEDALEELLSR